MQTGRMARLIAGAIVEREQEAPVRPTDDRKNNRAEYDPLKDKPPPREPGQEPDKGKGR